MLNVGNNINQSSSDAIRHLEKDMGDLLTLLELNPEISEIILNPYQKPDGSYEGHLLAEYQGHGLCHLVKTELINIVKIFENNKILRRFCCDINQIYMLDENDIVLHIRCQDESEIISWINLSKINDNINQIKSTQDNPLDFQFEANYCQQYFKGFILLLLRSGMVQIPDRIRSQLVLFAFKLEYEIIKLPCLWLNDFIEDIVSFLNKHLEQFVFSLESLTKSNLGKFTMSQNSNSGSKLSHNHQHINSATSPLNLYPQNIVPHTIENALFELYYSKLVIMSSTKAETIMSVLASITGKYIHLKNPYLECNIPKYGHRFTGVIPPVSNFPAFCIRTHWRSQITLEELVQQGVLQQSSMETIKSWIRRRFNILIAGGTGSGKTTLANAILYEISKTFSKERMLIIEDVPELKYNTLYSLSFTLNEFFSIYDALRTTLRFKPDRIIMGEVRGMEAYTLLKAWNTGHPGGVATIHANGVEEALFRFESCIRDHPQSKVNRQEIGFTINAIIAIQKVTLRKFANQEMLNVVERKVTALRQIINYDVNKDIYQDIVFDRLEENGFV